MKALPRWPEETLQSHSKGFQNTCTTSPGNRLHWIKQSYRALPHQKGSRMTMKQRESAKQKESAELTCSICNKLGAKIGLISHQRTHQHTRTPHNQRFAPISHQRTHQHTWTPHNHRLRWPFSRLRDIEPSSNNAYEYRKRAVIS